MERQEYKRIAAKAIKSRADTECLVLICKFLLERNDWQAEELKKALDKIEQLISRLEFYDRITILREVE